MRAGKYFVLAVACVMVGLGIIASGSGAPPARAAERCVIAGNGAASCWDDGVGGGGSCGTYQEFSSAPFVELEEPVVLGRFNIGRTLGVRACSSTAEATIQIQWKRNGVPIPGGDMASYVLTAADAGKTITARVTGSKPGFATTAKTSLPTVPIGPIESYIDPPVPRVVLEDSNYGSMAAGHNLVAQSIFFTSGIAQSWEYSELSYSYQWARDGAAIDGATGKTYTLTIADVGHHMTVTMTGWRPEWATVLKVSPPSAVIAAGPPPAIPAPADVIAPKVTASVAGGAYVRGQQVRLTADETAAVYYTTDGTTPSAASTRYTGPIVLTGNTALQYIGIDIAGNISGPAHQIYDVPEIPAPDTTAPSVVAAPAGGAYTVGQMVSLVTDETAAVYFTTDGTVPTQDSSPYTAPIRLAANTTIRYVAVDVTGNISPASAQTYLVSPASFLDVGADNQFHSEITWLAEHGVSTGWDESNGRTYRPYQPVNRDAMAAFMYRLAGSPRYNPPAVSPFVDVTPATQFYREIMWLADSKISTGWDEGDGRRTYRPLQPVNRDAMAAFMFRFAGDKAHLPPPLPPGMTPPGWVPKGTFDDVPGNSKFFSEIEWLARQGISTGWTVDSYPDGLWTRTRTYRPVQPVNRDAMAAFMYRYNSKFGTI